MRGIRAEIPLEEISRIQIYLNPERKSLAQVKEETGADYILNGGLFNLSTFRPECHLRVDGVTVASDQWGYYGYAWDTPANLAMEAVPQQAKANHIVCVCLIKDGQLQSLETVDPALLGERRRTVMGIRDGRLVLLCVSDLLSPAQLQARFMEEGGWNSALMLDGGASTQGDFGDGSKVASEREVANLICVYRKKEKEEGPMKRYRVIAEKGVNVRETPGGTIVGGCEYNTVVEVSEVKDGWAKTAGGWIYTGNLALVSDTTDPMVTVDMLPKGTGVRTGKKLTKLMGLVVHWIGVPQGKASVIRANFERDTVGTHYIIGWDTGEIIQCVPDDEVCYHVGSSYGYTDLKEELVGKKNPNWYFVGIECCIDPSVKIPADFASAGKYMDLGEPSRIQYAKLVAFSADFLTRHGLTVEHLYRHYDITGKVCPAWFVKDDTRWTKFKADVAAVMAGGTVDELPGSTEGPILDNTPAAWSKAAVDWVVESGLLQGDQDGNLALHSPVTMERLIVLLKRYHDMVHF